MLDLYASDGLLEEAQKVLHCPSSLNLVSSNEMVAGYVKHGLACSALKIFKDMQGDGLQPDIITYSSILKACNDREDLEQGRLIHSQMTRIRTELDEVAGSTLIDMYAKCGSLAKASQVFDDWPSRDRVMWSAMIGGYVQHNNFLLALELFSVFLQEGLQPDQVILSSILKACCHVGAIGHGLVLHDQIMRVSQQGEFEWAQRFMDAMQRQGWRPDEKTYGSILAGCSHAAKVDEGQQHFRSMGEDYGRITYQKLREQPDLFEVRGLVRTLGSKDRLGGGDDIFIADITRRETLTEAFDDIDALVILTSSIPKMKASLNPTVGHRRDFFFDEGGYPEQVIELVTALYYVLASFMDPLTDSHFFFKRAAWIVVGESTTKQYKVTQSLSLWQRKESRFWKRDPPLMAQKVFLKMRTISLKPN
ncbi:hypothetical protein L7F22_042858 [Adiantum nelumboides]|nr:hypothetical protein [Adiantum nelumboides]